MSQQIWRAIGEKRLRHVQWLINETNIGPSINDTFAHGWSCLHACCERGYTEVVEQLIEMGAIVNDADWSGDTPLHHAAAYSNTALVKLLFSANAKQVKNDAGRTPVHVAALKGQAEMAELLLNNDKSLVNAQDKTGITALHDAAEKGSLPSAIVLCKFGADPNKKNNSGLTPYHTAVEHEKMDVAKYLVNHKSFDKSELATKQSNSNKTSMKTADQENKTKPDPANDSQPQKKSSRRKAPSVPSATTNVPSEKL